ncbi:solute carrier family 45 member 3-like [Argonauta hians]
MTLISQTKKTLALSQMVLLNSVVFGVEICACAGFTCISPLLLKVGYSEENMSIILGMGPLLCLIIVPLIGRASDHCKSKYGRRRPFIFWLSLLILLSLVFILSGDSAYHSELSELIPSTHVGVLTLTAGVILLDFSTQSLLTPCEALLSDASEGTDQKERIFTIYSFMVSFGGCVGYLITAIDWSNTRLGNYFGGQEQSIFAILIILYFLSSAATLMIAEETPQTQMIVQDNPSSLLYSAVEMEESPLVLNNIHESGYETSSNESTSDDNANTNSPIALLKNQRLPPARTIKSSSLYIKRIFSCIVGLLLTLRIPFIYHICKYLKRIIRSLWTGIYHRLPENIQCLLDVPLVLQKLAAANFCSWTAVMGFTLFYTDYVGQAVYDGNPNAPENSLPRNNFDEGVRMGSWGLLLHCMTSAAYSPFIERLVERYGCRMTYMWGMGSFSVAMFTMVLCHNIILVNAIAAVTGFGFATLTTIPFILVSDYHANKELFFFDVERSPSNSSIVSSSSGSSGGIGCSSSSSGGGIGSGSVGGGVSGGSGGGGSGVGVGGVGQSHPHLIRGIATDMAILDSTYFLSQVILSGLMGYVVHLTGTVLSYILTAGVMGVLSCVFSKNIIVNKQDILKHVRHSRHRTMKA